MSSGPSIAIVGSGQVAGDVREALLAAGVDCARVGRVAQLEGADLGVVVVVEAIDIAEVRSQLGPDAAILAWSDDEAGALAAGATDVARRSGPIEVLIARVRNLWSAREGDDLGRSLAEVHEALVKVQGVLADGGDSPESLRAALALARDVMGYERASVVANIEASERAYVIAATDDPTLQQFTLGIWDYPEIREAVRNAEPVIIDDALEHPVTSEVAAKLRDSGVRAILVVPVLWKGRALGATVFRKNSPGPATIPSTRLSFVQLFASRIAAHLRDSQVVQSLRDQTHRISRASYEAERRLRTVESLKEHFQAAADGVLVIGDDGAIIFANGVAEGITGFASDALQGALLYDLILDEERGALDRALACVLGGDNVGAFDLHLSTTAGQPVCVSVTTSTVLAKSGVAILSFREITQERMLETELRKTKE
ncbi:MAG: GAF domain-containing protein, partial [Deltaproteobacteria bacterium]|nr:GAF domain-containing protein [Deltaproteobacteria bacterium]